MSQLSVPVLQLSRPNVCNYQSQCYAMIGFLIRYQEETIENAYNFLKTKYQRTKDYTPSIRVLSMLSMLYDDVK